MRTCRDICDRRELSRLTRGEDDSDSADKDSDDEILQEQNIRKRAERLAKYQNTLYNQGMASQRYSRDTSTTQRLSVHPPTAQDRLLSSPDEPVLMNLDGVSYQTRRNGRNKARLADSNSNMSRENPNSGTNPELYPIKDYYNTMARDRAKVKTVTSNANILTEKNPDIFETPPRPGGFLKIAQLPEPKLLSEFDICQRCNNIYENELKAQLQRRRSNPSLMSSRVSIHPVERDTPSREFRIRRALEESDWETTIIDETDTVVGISNPYHLSMNMLAVTITCVMMMASKIDMSKEYLDWSEGYLRCIKDENNRTPRNIGGLLREIKRRKAKAAEQTDRDQQNTYRSPDLGTEIEKHNVATQPGKKTQPRPVRAERSTCRSTCTTVPNKKGNIGACTIQSSCVPRCFKCPNPCPSCRMPRCNTKCSHVHTIDDFIAPEEKTSRKKHV